MMKLFVWDLHGTLEQGNDKVVVDVSNRVLAEHGRSERFTYEDGAKLYGSKWYEYFEWLLPQETYETWSRLQDDCFRTSERDIALQCKWLRPTDHAIDVLSQIAEHQEWHQILVSNTRVANLKIFVDVLGLTGFFPDDARFAVDGHTLDGPATKRDVVRTYLEGRSIQDLVFVGDSPSDMRLTEIAGGTSYLYSHDEFPFRECEADYKIRDLREILKSCQ
ncbi:Phosphoglycolate phosphatase, HAD superfamily [Streptomyces sp. cf124]|uniref:HAD family hydrolase n=1 Tax=unclassified Streptomyces TaxID=2593676 RepID=UPI0005ED7193|nr:MULTISPECIES: HAD family hydrolase [unclassified Streptomyces]SFN94557.1 Phosphoglycolate phosphatase, HAD superfamily [Streptomyces sp. cf124]